MRSPSDLLILLMRAQARPIHKPLLVATTAIALTSAILSATASAQEEPVEVVDEATGARCELTRANCRQLFSGSTRFDLRQFGASTRLGYCKDEITTVLDHNGSGYVETYRSDSAVRTSCTRVMCNGVGMTTSQSRWPITRTGEYTGNRTDAGHATVTLCLESELYASDAPTRCVVQFKLEHRGNHSYSLSNRHTTCPLLNRLVWIQMTNAWTSSPTSRGDSIELRH